jgi:3-oxoadipate enol-lactonase
LSVLVLANALGTTADLWKPQLPGLSRFQVARAEHRGRDTVEALARDVLELLDELGAERVSFCGLSIGGAVGMWLAANAPARIDRLVLACTSARFASPDSWRARAELVRGQGTEAVVDLTLGRWFTPRFTDRAPYRAMLLGTPRAVYAAHCEALAGWDFRDRLGAIEAPTLVIAAAADPSTPPAHGELIADRIPGARLVVLPDAAHLANVEQPAAFTRALLEHLSAASEEVA